MCDVKNVKTRFGLGVGKCGIGVGRPQKVGKCQRILHCIKFQNFHFFARTLCQNALRQRLRTGFVLHPTGPASERPYAFKGGPLNFGPRPPLGGPPPKFFPKFPKNLRGGGQFFECAIRGPQGQLGIKFRQLYLGPLSQKKIRNFAEFR